MPKDTYGEVDVEQDANRLVGPNAKSKSQRLDLEEVWATQGAIEKDTQGMCAQLGVETGTKTLKEWA